MSTSSFGKCCAHKSSRDKKIAGVELNFKTGLAKRRSACIEMTKGNDSAALLGKYNHNKFILTDFCSKN